MTLVESPNAWAGYEGSAGVTGCRMVGCACSGTSPDSEDPIAYIRVETMMPAWLVKTEPSEYSYADLERDGMPSGTA